MNEIKKVRVGDSSLRDFLSLPKKLYKKHFLMQDRAEEKAQLMGTHPLSSHYQLEAYVVYHERCVVARAALICYPDLERAYVGYFEAKNDTEAVLALFERLKERASELGKSSIAGPVQASFWLGYRMKLDHFEESPFTGEPSGKVYYPTLWQAAGFSLSERYHSVFYQEVPFGDKQERLEKRYQQFVEKGYRIVSPKREDWPQVSRQVFTLLSKLYSDFPLYHSIREEEFATLFAPYQNVLDFSMVRLAYKDGILVGFLISLPDYGNVVYGRLTPLSLLRILQTRKKAKRYAILYLGVEPGHLGLGSALAYPIYKAIQERRAVAIAALIHQGKITENYATSLKEHRHSYGIFEATL